MPDFTSALYLGLRHPTGSLLPWSQLTSGVPAALREPALAGLVAARLAALVGVERAVLARSTLHAFWDLMGALAPEPGAVYVDAGAYEIARWATARVAARGVPVRPFPHGDAAALRALLGRRRRGPAPWILSDGVCAGCGCTLPLRAYAALAADHGGRLLVDDTQALGLLGDGADPVAPYGRGGGGSLRATGVAGHAVILVASLAKAFGAPVAVVAGPAAAVGRIRAADGTRVHASPPSAADLAAAERALRVNRCRGAELRRRLAAVVRRLRAGLRRLGLGAGPTPFPVQRVRGLPPDVAVSVHRALAASGVAAVLHRPACATHAALAFVLRADHRPVDVDRALHALARALASEGAPAPRRTG